MRGSLPDEDARACIGTRDEEKLERSAPKGEEDLVQSTEVERRGIFLGVRFRVGRSLDLSGALPQMVVTWVRP